MNSNGYKIFIPRRTNQRQQLSSLCVVTGSYLSESSGSDGQMSSFPGFIGYITFRLCLHENIWLSGYSSAATPPPYQYFNPTPTGTYPSKPNCWKKIVPHFIALQPPTTFSRNKRYEFITESDSPTKESNTYEIPSASSDALPILQ